MVDQIKRADHDNKATEPNENRHSSKSESLLGSFSNVDLLQVNCLLIGHQILSSLNSELACFRVAIFQVFAEVVKFFLPFSESFFSQLLLLGFG